MDIVVLTFDCLPVSFLGCHGSEMADTPAFDRIAERGCVFAQCFTDHLHGQRPESWWVPEKSLEPGFEGPSLIDQIRDAGIPSCLIVESPEGIPASGFPDFDRRIDVDGSDGWDCEGFETPFAQLVAEAVRQLEATDEEKKHRLLWLASRGVPCPWVPPSEFGERMLEALEHEAMNEAESVDDSSNPDSAAESQDTLEESPSGSSDEDDDDLMQFLEWICRGGQSADGEPIEQLTSAEWQMSRGGVAGYVEMLDHWLDMLCEHLFTEPDRMLIVTAGRGLHLAEHHSPAGNHDPLCEANLHVPLIIIGPGIPAAQHHQPLVQPADISVTVQEMLGLPMSPAGVSILAQLDPNRPEHRAAVLSTRPEGGLSLRNSEVHFISAQSASSIDSSNPMNRCSRMLFRKHEDIWEWLDIADQDSERMNAWEQTESGVRDAIQAGTLDSVEALNNLVNRRDEESTNDRAD